MTYISSQSMAAPLRLSVLQAQTELTQAQTEISTGVKADLGLSLGGRTGYSLSLKSEVDRLSSFSSTNSLASTRLSATSSALDTILSAAQKMSASLTLASNSGVAATSVQSDAKASLETLIGNLNTSAGGQFVFGGIKTDASPLSSYSASSSAKQAVDNAFQTTFGTSQTSAAAGSISGTDMQSFLDGPFASLFSDSGWQTNWSGASSEAIQTGITPSQSITTSVSANDAAFRQITQAYTMLSEFTGQNLGDDARNAVVATATKLVNTAIASLTNVQSGVGVAQSTIETANTQITTQIDTLKTGVGDLENVDPYALSSKITQLQTQLQASYELTSRLSQLSLVNYLNG